MVGAHDIVPWSSYFDKILSFTIWPVSLLAKKKKELYMYLETATVPESFQVLFCSFWHEKHNF